MAMKKILSFFLLMSTFCFSMSPIVETNLAFAHDKEKINHWQESLDLMTYLIEDTEISYIDRVHYLWHRHWIYMIKHEVELYLLDIQFLKNICDVYPECKDELIEHYGNVGF